MVGKVGKELHRAEELVIGVEARGWNFVPW
jgi:hypothetical protein